MLLACLIPGNLTLGPDSCLLTPALATVLASHVLVMDSTDVLQGDSRLVILIRENGYSRMGPLWWLDEMRDQLETIQWFIK